MTGRAVIAGFALCVAVYSVLALSALVTLWMLRVLFLPDLAFTFRTITAAAVLNLILGWIGAAPLSLWRNK